MLIGSALFLQEALHAPIVQIRFDLKRPLRTFNPRFAFGAGIDGHEQGATSAIFRRRNIAAMRSIGLPSLTYRLRTELAIEAWHWNPRGRWSNASARNGYWTSDSRPTLPITRTFGYALPRRGATIDQANNLGYSRIDDGDLATFWKSNPYLSPAYTHQPESAHPQWIVIDLGSAKPINHAVIDWAQPYAASYKMEFWNGPNNELEPELGDWQTFPRGKISNGKGGHSSFSLSTRPCEARYIRLTLLRSSGTALPGSRDVRDHLGFAIREVKFGLRDSSGFHDAMTHGKHGHQSVISVSSTDSWHRSRDLDKSIEQPGFDTLFQSGITNKLPVLMPIPVLFGNPVDAVGLVRYFKRRGWPIRGIEMGEEPDGQVCTPQDYGELYIQTARKLHSRFPKLVLGGPCFQTTETDFREFPMPPGTPSWLKGFLQYLKKRRSIKELGFFSMEWYPFDNVGGLGSAQALEHFDTFQSAIDRLRREGLTHEVPWLMTEYGFSAFGGQPEVELTGALVNAEIVGLGLQIGFQALFLYGYEPAELLDETNTNSWGNNAILIADSLGNWRYRTATYWGGWLLNHEWTAGIGTHRLYKPEFRSDPSIDLFPIRKPDGRLSVLILNKDPVRAVRLTLPDMVGPVRVSQFGERQYKWHPNGEDGHPSLSQPPEDSMLASGSTVFIPPNSLTVVQELPTRLAQG